MKKLIIVAAFVLAAAFGAKAQTVSKMETANDSISMMFGSLQSTNKELVYINDNLRLHSQIALGSFALEGIGAACLLLSSPVAMQGFSDLEPLAKLGVGFCFAGGIGFICSYIPIWTSKVHLDERGLIIDLP